MDPFAFFLQGSLFGLIAGISPGPLLALVVSQTLKHDLKEGVKIAFVPLLSDLPVVAAALFIASRTGDPGPVLGAVSVLGALYLAYLGYENIAAPDIGTDAKAAPPHSLLKGVTANLLSPHVYLFWTLIGIPVVVKAGKVGPAAVALFIAGFYLFIVGTKALLAWGTRKGGAFLNGKAYTRVIQSLGIALIFLALLLAADGIRYLT